MTTALSIRCKLRRLKRPISDDLDARAKAEIREARRITAKERRVARIACAEQLGANVSLAVEEELTVSKVPNRIKRALSRALTTAIRGWMER